MMNKSDLIELIKTGEGYTLEFKESLNSSIGKEICAFANADGGKILLGVRDDNSIKGFTLTNDISSKIQIIIGNINPKLNVTFEVIEDIGVIYVPKGNKKPYAVNSEFYLRQGANSQKLTRDEILEFFRNSNKISFERQANDSFDLEKDFDENKFKRFIERAKITDSLSTEHILNNLNLLTEGKPNNACVLLFPHKVTKFFLSGDISCVLYAGKSTMLDKKVFDADFISNFENAVQFILRNTRTKADIVGLKRIETPEIPEKALREAILNAMIHKDYFIEGRILINIFEDQVEIGNPGKLLFNQKELGKVSILRNPIIADCILRTGFVEKIGSGIKRIKELVPTVKFEISSNWFRVVFVREVVFEVGSKVGSKITANQKGIIVDLFQELGLEWSEKWSEQWSEKWSELSKRRQQIIILLLEKPQINRNQLSAKLSINPSAIQKHLDKLKELGYIKRVGPDKGGHWEVLV